MRTCTYVRLFPALLLISFLISPAAAGSPSIGVEPASFEVMLLPEQSAGEPLTINNLGDETLSWSVTEAVNTTGQTLNGDRDNTIPAGSPTGQRGSVNRDNPRALNAAAQLDEPIPGWSPINPLNSVVDCDAERDIIINDSGTVMTGYSGNPNLYDQVMFVDWFVPAAYPASFTAVCIAFLTMGPPTLDFQVVVFADDHTDGGPGTELGALPASAEGIPGVAGTPVWFSYDISSLGIEIDEGGVYVGIRFVPPAPPVFIGADEAPPNPPGFAGGYWWNDVDDAWEPIELAFPSYRSLFVRTVADTSESCMLPTWIEVDLDSGAIPGGESQLVEVTFDADGLDRGTYHANLCLASNDPDTPLLKLPVVLEVGDSVIGVDADSLSSTLGMDQIEFQSLTVSNLGVGTLTWSVNEDPRASAAVPESGGITHRHDPATRARDAIGDRSFDRGADLATVLGEHLPGLRPIALFGSVIDCDNAPGIIINDDGSAENGYTATPPEVTEVVFVDEFTPAIYPASLTGACVAFTTLGPTELELEIVVFAADGDDGSPGTELGALPALIENIPSYPSPEVVWASFDISSLDIEIESGSVFIGVRYVPMAPDNVYISADQTPINPPGFAGGYRWTNDVGEWVPLEDLFPSYRALFIRAVADRSELPNCTLPEWVSVDPVNGAVSSGDSHLVNVSFNAGELIPGEYEAHLCLTNNDPTRPVVAIPLSLTVLDQAPAELATDPESLGFGQVDLGQTAMLTFEVLNTAAAGAAGLTLTAIMFDGDNVFETAGGSCMVGSMLDPGDSCTIEMSFTPGEAGLFSGDVTVEGNNRSAVVTLSGTGHEPSEEVFSDRFEQ